MKQQNFPSLLDLFHDFRQMKFDIRMLNQRLKLLEEKEKEEMAALDDLKLAVDNAVGAENSAVVLIEGLVAQLKEALAHDDTAALTDLVNKLAASTGPLAAAVAANPLHSNTVTANT